MYGLFSPFRLVFDLIYGLLFGHDQSNGFHIFNFNAYICLFLTLIVFLVGPILISSVVNYRPAPSFIPVSERHTAAVTSHHNKTPQVAHIHHTNGPTHSAVKAHKPLTHNANKAK